MLAYMKGEGYVGYGVVTAEAIMIRDFEVEGKPLLQLSLEAAEPTRGMEDPQLSEWVVGIDWKKTYPREQAQTFKGVFANQNVVCKRRDSETVSFVRQRFGIPEG